jgi:hypothetical protein
MDNSTSESSKMISLDLEDFEPFETISDETEKGGEIVLRKRREPRSLPVCDFCRTIKVRLRVLTERMIQRFKPLPLFSFRGNVKRSPQIYPARLVKPSTFSEWPSQPLLSLLLNASPPFLTDVFPLRRPKSP